MKTGSVILLEPSGPVTGLNRDSFIILLDEAKNNGIVMLHFAYAMNMCE